jgi:DNA-binding HxlR family transcriptional regulator
MSVQPRDQRSGCPISTALDRFGDRWTLLIVRDLVAGKARYGAFESSAEAVPTNILAARLKQMIADGLIEKSPYQNNPVRYEYGLTEKGRALIPLLQEMCRWSKVWEDDTWSPPGAFMMLKP